VTAEDDQKERIRQWQRGPGRVGYLGKRLSRDGIEGPSTLWARYLETLEPWRQSAVRAMLSLRGLQEQGINRGTVPDFVLALADAATGSPWCAATYSWALWIAGLCQRSFCPSASVVELRGQLLPVSPEQTQAGDFASLVHADGTHGHGGMVIWPGVIWLASCDANISNQVDVVQYPKARRQYHSPILDGGASRVGEPPASIRLYTGGATR
jgi:hypothetical protein